MRNLNILAVGALALFLALPLGCGGENMMGGEPAEPEVPATPLVFPDEPFRGMRPSPAMASPYHPPSPEVFKLDNGLEIFLVERRTVPAVSWYLTFPLGSLMDPPGKEGLASLCMNVGFQGSQTLNRGTREQQLADTGSSVGIGTASHYVEFGASALQPHVDATLAMWVDLFLAPALGQGSFDGTKQVRMAGLSGGPSLTPASISSRVTSRVYWGATHPYNREITGASLQAVTLQDCKDFFTLAVRPVGAKLFVSGAINKSEVLSKFSRLNAMSGSPLATPPPPPATRLPGTVFFVDSPGAPQSIVSLRAPGPARTAPEYFATDLMAGILAGDSISSRIGQNVREMRGYAYSFSGGLGFSLTGGYFFFSAPVRADATAESVFEVLEEIRKLREGSVSDDELAREREGRVAGLPYLFETAGQTIGQYDVLDYYGLPRDYFRGYAARYAAVTPAAIQQAAAQVFSPGSLQVVVVGDAATVLPKLRMVAAMRPDLMGAEVMVLSP